MVCLRFVGNLVIFLRCVLDLYLMNRPINTGELILQKAFNLVIIATCKKVLFCIFCVAFFASHFALFYGVGEGKFFE